MKIRRINILGGPGRGKSTLAAALFAEFKNAQHQLGLQVELVQEFVKTWAYTGRRPEGFDQFFVTASQMQAEEILLRSGVDVVITDSPVVLGTTYAPAFLKNSLQSIVASYEAAYPSLNVILDCKKPFFQKGRFQTETEAEVLHQQIVAPFREQENSLVISSFNPEGLIMPIYQRILGVQ